MTIKELMEKDPSFTESSFVSKVDNTFIMILSGISSYDIDRVKHKISDNLYQIYKRKVENLKANKEIQMYDELNVSTTKVQRVEEDDDFYILTVMLEANYMDYRIDAVTREYKEGINDHRIHKCFNLTYKKRKDALTNDGMFKCPTCGAVVDVNRSGVCEYCHTIFNLSDYDWILTNIS